MKKNYETSRNIKAETQKETFERNRLRAKQICKIYKNHQKHTNYKTFLIFCKDPEKIQYILDYKYNIESSIYNSEFLEIKIDR